MSYEGYTEVLCEQGHLRHRWYDYNDTGAVWACDNCGSPAAWTRQVDQTNGTDPDEPWTMPYTFTVRREQDVAVCNLGHTHVIREREYMIPRRMSLDTSSSDPSLQRIT